MTLRAFLILAAVTLTPCTALAQVGNRTPAAVTGSPTVQINTPAQSDNCSLPVSLGYGSPVLGATFVWSHADGVCQHIRLFYALRSAGYPVGALQVLCGLQTVRDAMKRAGTPCEAQH